MRGGVVPARSVGRISGELSRREFLRALSAALAAAGLAPLASPRWGSGTAQAASLGLPSGREPGPLRHLAWVWQFSTDGPPEQIRSVLGAHQLGITLKTHDGVEWMAEYDKSPQAVNGPARVGELAAFFEAGGVPFHAWCVVKGRDPRREAAMAAEVLGRGARSLLLDIEPHSGFWEGTPADAVAFGRELRRLRPDAWILVSIDPRPWLLPRIPLQEFAAFSDGWAPLVYWESFNTQPNIDRLAAAGTAPGPDGVTPRFLLDLTALLLEQYRLPILPIGQGDSTGAHWKSFVGQAFDHGMEAVSVWRYGVTKPEVWQLLRDNPPLAKEEIYVVQPGDTLSGIAQRYESSVSAIVEHNGIENPNFLRIGQELRIPRVRRRGGGGPAPAPAPAPAPTPAPAPGSRATYEVQPGDTLNGLARRWQTTSRAIADANGLVNPDLIQVGQRLIIP